MRISLPNAVLAFLVISQPTSARRQRRGATCQESISLSTTSTSGASPSSTSGEGGSTATTSLASATPVTGILWDGPDGEVYVPAPVEDARSDSTTHESPDSSSTEIPFLRGVNLGGWLVVEGWMTSLFKGHFADATDQWTFDSIDGAQEVLETHWSTYIVESDIQAIAATGINALRIPIGYWAFDNYQTPYVTGADHYLEQAVDWARTAGMKVWIDLHGSPGSQNGFDNSGHGGNVRWQLNGNLDRSIAVLETMATKYGAIQYSDVVVGIELVNEPIGWAPNNFTLMQEWAHDAYKAVKAASSNPDLVIVMHDAFMGPLAWTPLLESVIGDGPRTFGIDTHLYQIFGEGVNELTQAEHIAQVCDHAADLAEANGIAPTFVGEWAPVTNTCVHKDGSTTPGTSCDAAGCQCQSESFSSWKTALVGQVRRFVEAQLDVFEATTSGYFMWSAKGPGSWSFLEGIESGIIPNPVTSRKYAMQCDNVDRVVQRG